MNTDDEQFSQLLKQAIADKDYKRHIDALFNALQAKKEKSDFHLFSNLSKDYFIALYGGKLLQKFFQKSKNN